MIIDIRVVLELVRDKQYNVIIHFLLREVDESKVGVTDQ